MKPHAMPHPKYPPSPIKGQTPRSKENMKPHAMHYPKYPPSPIEGQTPRSKTPKSSQIPQKSLNAIEDLKEIGSDISILEIPFK